jgi:hypothetical protein
MIKTLLLVIVAFILGSLATAAIAQVTQAPAIPPAALLETGAIYLRDAKGRCLRVQLQTVDGKVIVVSVPTEVCAEQEAPRR